MYTATFWSLIICLLISTTSLAGGLEEFDILISPDGKQRIILAGENHFKLPGSQTERLAAAIAECQKDDPTPFEVHIEKPATIFTEYNNTPCITIDLEPIIKTIPGIMIEDCEVRNVAILAFSMFNREYPVSTRCKIKTGNKESCIRTATLQDLDNEFEELYSSLAAFAQTLPESHKEKFEKILLQARILLKKFHRNIEPHVHESNTIIETAIKLAAYDRENKCFGERGRIRDYCIDPFSELFNLNLIRTILISQNSKKLILSGFFHTQATKKFLVESQWQVVHQQTDENPENIVFHALLKLKEFVPKESNTLWRQASLNMNHYWSELLSKLNLYRFF